MGVLLVTEKLKKQQQTMEQLIFKTITPENFPEIYF